MTVRILLASALLFSLLAVPPAPAGAQTDELNRQRQSFLGAGVRFSADKPSFRGRATETRESEKVKKATEGDPMAGGLLTSHLGGLGGDVEYRYRYEYPYEENTVLFDGSAVGVLCESCKAKAVLDACGDCEGKSFAKLCDKCKARAILNACDEDRAKISSVGAKEKKTAKADGRKKKRAAKKTDGE